MAGGKISPKILILLFAFTGPVLDLQKETPNLDCETRKDTALIPEFMVFDKVKNRNRDTNGTIRTVFRLYSAKSRVFKHFASTQPMISSKSSDIPLYSSESEEDNSPTEDEDGTRLNESVAMPSMETHDRVSVVDFHRFQTINTPLFAKAARSSEALEGSFLIPHSTTDDANRFSHICRSSFSSAGPDEQVSSLRATPVMCLAGHSYNPTTVSVTEDDGSSDGEEDGISDSEESESSDGEELVVNSGELVDSNSMPYSTSENSVSSSSSSRFSSRIYRTSPVPEPSLSYSSASSAFYSLLDDSD